MAINVQMNLLGDDGNYQVLWPEVEHGEENITNNLIIFNNNNNLMIYDKQGQKKLTETLQCKVSNAIRNKRNNIYTLKTRIGKEYTNTISVKAGDTIILTYFLMYADYSIILASNMWIYSYSISYSFFTSYSYNGSSFNIYYYYLIDTDVKVGTTLGGNLDAMILFTLND